MLDHVGSLHMINVHLVTVGVKLPQLQHKAFLTMQTLWHLNFLVCKFSPLAQMFCFVYRVVVLFTFMQGFGNVCISCNLICHYFFFCGVFFYVPQRAQKDDRRGKNFVMDAACRDAHLTRILILLLTFYASCAIVEWGHHIKKT